MKVCVIGAGMAGLAALRELRREGHEVTVLEQSGDIGGQWLYDPAADEADPLGALAPVKVHSSMYASVRLISPRGTPGFTDFPFTTSMSGRDNRRYPGHREVYLYLKDFCEAFGLMDAVRLNTKVLRVAMTPSRCQWTVRSVGLTDGDDEKEAVLVLEEVFDAAVVATGHYSQPRFPTIQGMETWRGKQMHSHSYRVAEPFRGQVVVVVGSGESGKDIAMELRGVAKELELLGGDGQVVFGDGSVVVADTIIYCTGYNYSFPFLDTAGAVTIDENCVGPLFEHVFPPSLAPSLSFVGIPKKVFAPRFFETQARWVAQVLSGKRTLPTEKEMLQSVDEFYRARGSAGYLDEFGHKYCDFPRVERWNYELLVSSVNNMINNFETFRDDYQDSDSILKVQVAEVPAGTSAPNLRSLSVRIGGKCGTS
ncbi:hypothetical protein BRADI_3g10572v3, partial [Brachypodium distachyon]